MATGSLLILRAFIGTQTNVMFVDRRGGIETITRVTNVTKSLISNSDDKGTAFF